MFLRMKGFLSRHKRKFMVGGIVFGGVYFASRYLQHKIQEWQENETKEFLDRTRKQHHFESTEKTCNQTIISLAPSINEVVEKLVPTEEIVELLKSNPSNKVELWQKLKISTFTLATAVIYTETLLVLALRIQLNLIGGYVFLDVTKEKTRITSEMKQQYLSLCHHFIDIGIKKLCSYIEQKVEFVVKSVSLKQQLTLSGVEEMFWTIQASIAKDPKELTKILHRFFVPETRDYSPDLLNTMISETMDLLECEEVSSLASSCISCGFTNLVDLLADNFSSAKGALPTTDNSNEDGKWVESLYNEFLQKDSNKSGLQFVHPSKFSIPMAKFIPILNRVIQVNITEPFPWLQQLIANEKLKVLGANIYESFSQQ